MREVIASLRPPAPNAVANPHFADFRYRDLSTGLFFDREQIAEMVERIRQKLSN
jgi:hypothetical protein